MIYWLIQFTFIVTEERTRKIGFIILATDNVSNIFPACNCDETQIAQCNENISHCSLSATNIHPEAPESLPVIDVTPCGIISNHSCFSFATAQIKAKQSGVEALFDFGKREKAEVFAHWQFCGSAEETLTDSTQLNAGPAGRTESTEFWESQSPRVPTLCLSTHNLTTGNITCQTILHELSKEYSFFCVKLMENS